jgi:hypothetical protein
MRARLAEKIEIHLLAAHQPFELGDAGIRMRQRRTLVVIGRYRFELPGPWLRTPLAIQSLGSMRRPSLDPVVQNFARYLKLASHRQNAFASLNALDRLQFERRRKLTVLSSCCHRSSSKCLSPQLPCLT